MFNQIKNTPQYPTKYHQLKNKSQHSNNGGLLKQIKAGKKTCKQSHKKGKAASY